MKKGKYKSRVQPTLIIVALLLAVALAAAPAPASAQESGDTQVFLGYSFIEMAPAGKEIACAGSCPPEVQGFELEKQKMSGWHASVTCSGLRRRWRTG